jgi:hypothetical protein
VPVCIDWGVLIVICMLSVCRLLHVEGAGIEVAELIPFELACIIELFATAFNEVCPYVFSDVGEDSSMDPG